MLRFSKQISVGSDKIRSEKPKHLSFCSDRILSRPTEICFEKRSTEICFEKRSTDHASHTSHPQNGGTRICAERNPQTPVSTSRSRFLSDQMKIGRSNDSNSMWFLRNIFIRSNKINASRNAALSSFLVHSLSQDTLPRERRERGFLATQTGPSVATRREKTT